MRKTGINRNCLICKKEIYVPAWLWLSGAGRHCSQKCQYLDRLGKPAWNRGLKMPFMNRQMKKGFLPKRAFTKGDSRISGKNNNNWHGGIDSETHKRVNTPEWKVIRDDVYRRDQWLCQRCSKKCRTDIQCHHIVPWKISHNDH